MFIQKIHESTDCLIYWPFGYLVCRKLLVSLLKMGLPEDRFNSLNTGQKESGDLLAATHSKRGLVLELWPEGASSALRARVTEGLKICSPWSHWLWPRRSPPARPLRLVQPGVFRREAPSSFLSRSVLSSGRECSDLWCWKTGDRSPRCSSWLCLDLIGDSGTSLLLSSFPHL